MGSSTSTHAKAASASTDSSITRGSNRKQQIGVSGRICVRSGTPCTEYNGKTEPTLKRLNVLSVITDDESFAEDATLETHISDSESVATDSDSDSDDEENCDDCNEDAKLILEDAQKLKILADAFLHPEKKVTTTDPTAFGRNFFTTPSFMNDYPTETVEEAHERAMILHDAAHLNTVAVYYGHPELPVTQTAEERMRTTARNYFSTQGAQSIPQESWHDAEERARIMDDAQKLQTLAVDYMHPEIGVRKNATDWALFGRNYFNRPSAIDVDITKEEEEERALIMLDLKLLQQAAKDYLHPEIGVVNSSDGTLYGRNYFNRPSAPDTEDDDFADERAEILEEMASLTKLAVDYMHPELGVTSSDPTLFGRNYFNRPSAPDTDDYEFANERAQVLTEAANLKKLAADYMHPELGVVTSDALLYGRNYFNRVSAPETEVMELANERAQVLAEAASLKKLAVDYMHPEIGVVNSSDGTLYGRNYFNRPSAPDTEDDDFADERVQVLIEAANLKKLAADYMHPEVGVISSDPATFGHNFFGPVKNAISTHSVIVNDSDHASEYADESEVSYDPMFEWDEHDHDFTEMRNTFATFVSMESPLNDDRKQEEYTGKGEEGDNLSRSPSNVMLFGLEGSV